MIYIVMHDVIQWNDYVKGTCSSCCINLLPLTDPIPYSWISIYQCLNKRDEKGLSVLPCPDELGTSNKHFIAFSWYHCTCNSSPYSFVRSSRRCSSRFTQNRLSRRRFYQSFQNDLPSGGNKSFICTCCRYKFKSPAEDPRWSNWQPKLNDYSW